MVFNRGEVRMGLKTGLIEIYLIQYGKETYKLVINKSAHVFTFYAHSGRIMFRREHMTDMAMADLHKAILKYMEDNKEHNRKYGGLYNAM